MAISVKPDEVLDFGNSFFGVTVNGHEVFHANDLKPAGRPDRWALRLIEKRDVFDLQGMAVDVAVADSRDAIVVDGTSSSPRFGGERGSPLRTVSVFIACAGNCPLVSLRRRDEGACDDWAGSLAAEALGETLSLLAARGLDLAGTRVVSLEPELGTPADRRRLVDADISYAIKDNEDDRFSPALWRPDDPLDSIEPKRADRIFLENEDRRIVPIRDLRGAPGTGAELEEYLTMCDGPAGSEYFLVRAALPPGTKPGDVYLAVRDLARGAADYAADTPGEALRLHEFHHPNEGPYCAALRIADRHRYMDGLGIGGPNAQAAG
jgi:hypothetical protein